MDMDFLLDALILLLSGTIVTLFGVGVLFPKLAIRERYQGATMNYVIVFGAVMLLAGLVQLIRSFIT